MANQSLKTQLSEVNMMPVESSNIDSIGHNPDTKTIFIKFRTGSTYAYSPFTEEGFVDFYNATSHGKYFYYHIRTNENLECNQVF